MAGHRSWRCRVVTPEAPVPDLGDGSVMSSLIGSAAATTCRHPLSGDIPYLLWFYDGLTAAEENTILTLLLL